MNKMPRTTCSLCNLGCELAFEIEAGDIRKVSYVTDSRNQGRLCAKGNAAASIINHPKRLYNALIGKKPASIAKAVEYLKEKLESYKSDEILLVYDSSFTLEELDLLAGWARDKGFKNLSYAASGPEAAFLYGDTPSLDLNAVTAAQYAFIIGDPFSQESVFSGYLAQAKESSKGFRYIVADSYATITSNFAHRFIKVKPGFEGLFLYALLKEVKQERGELKSIAQTLGVEEEIFNSILEMMRNKQGVLVFASGLARSFDPFLTHAAALKLSRLLDGMIYIPLGNRPPSAVAKPFFSFVPAITSGKIRAMISFAARFPWNYTQLRPVMRKMEFTAASSLFIPEGRFEFDMVLPVRSEFGKKGMIRTLFGDAELEAFSMLSGTTPAGDLISMLGGSPSKSSKLPAFHPAFEGEAFEERARQLMNSQNDKPKKAMKYLLMGCEPAIGYLSVFENEDWIKINPAEALSLKVHEGDVVGLETEQNDIELKIRITNDIPTGMAVVSTNNKNVISVFELATDSATGEAFLKPTWSRIWKK